MQLKVIGICASVLAIGMFAIGRTTAPKPTPEIKYITKTQLVEKIVTQKVAEKKGHVVVDKTKTTNKDGEIIEHTKTELIYDNTKKEDIKSEIETVENTSLSSQETVKRPVNVFVMAGVPTDKMLDIQDYKKIADYQIGLVLPIGNTLTLNSSYQINAKLIWLGGGINFY